MQCAGNPHFWVNEDGSYQEEGQKNTKGYIWGKVCFFLSKIYIPFISIASSSFIEDFLLVLLFRLGPSYFVLYCRFLFHPNLLRVLLGNSSTVRTAEAFWTILSIELCKRFFWLETEVPELAQYSSRYELLLVNKSYPLISGYEICLLHVDCLLA